MTALLLLSTCLLLMLLCSSFNKNGARSAILQGYVLFASILAISTELLGINELITYSSLLIVWSCLTCIFTIALLYQMRSRGQHFHFLFSRIRSFSLGISTSTSSLFLGYVPVTMIILFTGFVAMYAPANTWDSLAYRMTKVEYWIQHKSLEFYATHDQRQLYVPPFLEMFMLHLRVLSGDDRLANIPQWLALVTATLGVTSITKQLGGNKKQQAFAAFFVSTIPYGNISGTFYTK